jgi:hypothetical protein
VASAGEAVRVTGLPAPQKEAAEDIIAVGAVVIVTIFLKPSQEPLFSATHKFPVQTGKLKVGPVYNSVPPFATLYQLNVPKPPEAVTVTVAPKFTLTAATETEGAIGEGETAMFSIPVTVTPFLVTEINPVVPLPANPVIEVADTTVKESTEVPPILTSETPVKFVPVIVNAPELAQSTVGKTPAIDGLAVDHA